MRIFHKLFLGFLSVALVSWAVGFFAIRNFQETQKKTVSGYVYSIASMILKNIDREIYEDFMKLKIRSKGETLQQTIEASNKVFEEMPDPEGFIKREDQAWLAAPGGQVTPFMQQILDLPLSRSFRQEQILHKEQSGRALFSELSVTNRFGVTAASSNKTTDYRRNDEGWWKEAWAKGFFFGPIEYDQSSKSYSLAIAVRIENDLREPVGVFKGVLDIREIDERLRQNERALLFRTGRLALLGANGRYIFPEEKFGKEADLFLRSCLENSHVGDESDFEIAKNKAGSSRFYIHARSSGYEKYPGGGWVLFVSYDESEMLEPGRKMGSLVFTVAGIATALSISFGLLLSISFSRPLEKLRWAADRFGKGDFGAKTGIVSRDEFGAVARDFEAMAKNLKNKTTSIEKLDQEIKDRKLLEKVSLENSLFLQRLMDSIPVPIFYKDISGVYIGCNRAFEMFFGIPQKELMGKKAKELFSPELAEVYQEKDAELFALPGIQIYEASVKDANGDSKSIVFYRATFNGVSGEVQGIIGAVMDVTFRKQAEEMLRESEERHRVLFESASDAIMTLEPPSWKFTSGNSAAIKMFGAENLQEFISHGLWDLSPEYQPDGRSTVEKAKEMIGTAMCAGDLFFEWMHKRISGENFPATVLLTRMEIKGKTMIQATVRDISAQKMAEAQILKLSQAVEQSPTCVVITDKDGKIEYVNHKFTEITGYSSSEAVGQNPRILKSEEHSPEFYKELWDTILGGKTWKGQLCNKKKSGDLYWESAHIAPIRDEKGEIAHFVAVKEDVTYQRQIEAELRHSLRMEAVGRLAGGIAHDFNNMLTVINGYSGYLFGKMKPEDPHYEKMREIRDAGNSAALVVRQLLNLSRKEAPKPQLIRVSEVAGKMEHMIDRMLKDDVEFKAEYGPDAGFVKLDPGQMEQVILNLLGNAREAMPEGGTLIMATDRVRIEEVQEELMPLQKRTGDFVRITVKDTGVGIDPVLRKRIFEPFFTTKEKGMNTGLGLSIVYGIVEQAGGAISIESQAGRGTTFRVYLPRAEGEGARQEESFEELPPGRGKILLVEDERQVREFALQVLCERGYDVRVVRGGEEALAMLTEDPGREFDLLLTDLTMPKMNGKELVLRVRKMIPGLKVIFMSGYSEQTVEGVEGTEFLQKPFSHGQLSAKVWSVLGR